MVGWSRNLNYVGEMMLYSSFAVIAQMWEIWYVFAYMWGFVFLVRMSMKEYSLSKKEGWTEYKNRTWFILPKIYNNSYLSYAFYASIVLFSSYCYINGGIEKGIKSIFMSKSSEL